MLLSPWLLNDLEPNNSPLLSKLNVWHRIVSDATLQNQIYYSVTLIYLIPDSHFRLYLTSMSRKDTRRVCINVHIAMVRLCRRIPLSSPFDDVSSSPPFDGNCWTLYRPKFLKCKRSKQTSVCLLLSYLSKSEDFSNQDSIYYLSSLPDFFKLSNYF